MSEQLAKFFESKGLNITKVSKEYIRLNIKEVNDAVLNNTIELAKEFDINKEKSYAYPLTNQLFIYIKTEIPKLEPIIEPIVEEIPIPVIEPEIIPKVEIPIPEEETSDKLKDIIEDLEDIVEDLED